ncbi:MAG: sigma-70 family RNA polymerase sigma factor [Gammaproteobacteria bacterium]|nr:sigma-70 family RNA polymerase sigma factor [Gammaproteobacteria bacterium]
MNDFEENGQYGKHQVTSILAEWHGDNKNMPNELMTLVYDELRRIAASYLRRERLNHTLQPTALVSEVFIKLNGHQKVPFQSRSHFLGVAAQAMRRILVDHARQYQTEKRPDPRKRATLIEVSSENKTSDIDVLMLDECLERLAAVEPRQAKAVEYNYFGGLTQKEIAAALNSSVATIEREIKAAKMALRTWMNE